MSVAIPHLTPFLLLLSINAAPYFFSLFYNFNRPFIFIETTLVVLLLFSKKIKLSFLFFCLIILVEIYIYIGKIFKGLNGFSPYELIEAFIESRSNAFHQIIFLAISAILIFYFYRKLSKFHYDKTYFLIFTIISTILYLKVPDFIVGNRILAGSLTLELIDKINSAPHDDAFRDFKLAEFSGESAIKKVNNIEQYDRVALIIIESLATYQKNDINDRIASKLFQNSDVEILKYGSIKEAESTVSAELRELCHVSAIGYGIASIPNEIHCNPKRFKDNDYYTFSLHAGGSKFYNRYRWYGSAGFTKSLFFGDLNVKEKCTNNWQGYCDINLFDDFFSNLDKRKNTFGYWLTLNSHYPYGTGDLFNKDKSECSALTLPLDESVCGNYLLVREFLSNLSDSISQNKQRIGNTIFIVVGDHQPYLIGKSEKSFLSSGYVPFFIFKLKR